MSSEPMSAKEPKGDKVYNEESCDVKLVSSDNVVFFVHSYHLLSASKGFRELLQNVAQPHIASNSSHSKRVIELVDSDFETNVTVRAFLDAIHGAKVPSKDDALSSLENLLQFLRKWDCSKQYSQLIFSTLPSLLLTPWTYPYGICDDAERLKLEDRAREAFFLACQYDAEDVVVYMFERSAIRTYAHHSYTKAVSVQEFFKPALLAPERHSKIGFRYIFAIDRAYIDCEEQIKKIRSIVCKTEEPDAKCLADTIGVDYELQIKLKEALAAWDKGHRRG